MTAHSIENCTCDATTGCGEYNEAGCPACRYRYSDTYLPCPVFGYMCLPLLGDVCDCCTRIQRARTRQYYENGR